MRGTIVLSTLSADRPGIVDELCTALAELNLNIEKSRMSVMGREFSVVMLISGDKGDLEKLITDADQRFSALQMDWVIRATGSATERGLEASLPYQLSVAAIDHIGLVARITHVLHSFNVNVEDLDSAAHPAPESGTPVFYLTGTVLVPHSVRLEAVRSALYDIADELNVDISFDPA